MDPVSSDLRKAVRGTGKDGDEKRNLLWGLVESGFEAALPPARNEEDDKPKNRLLLGAGCDVLLLENGEVLSDGELSDCGGEEMEFEEGEEKTEFRVAQRRELIEDEEEASFGVVFSSSAHLGQLSELETVRERLQKTKQDAEQALEMRLRKIDLSSVYFRVETTAGETIQGRKKRGEISFLKGFCVQL